MMMWRDISKHWQITGALLFSGLLIGGAYFFARAIESPPLAQASTETALLQAIATKDSTGDGLPDWQKVLYGIPMNSTTTDYFHLGMTDGEAVAKGLIVPKAIVDIPTITATSTTNTGIDYAAYGLSAPSVNTLTDAFAKSFFSIYLSAKQSNNGAALTSAQTSALADQALSQLTQTITPRADFRKAIDLKVSGSGADALRAFAVAAEAVLKRNKSDATMSEIGYLQSAVQDGDITALPHLVSLAKAYRDSAVGLAMLPVPQELADVHLVIVNSIMRLSEIDNDFARVNVDPLTAMLALQQYPQTELTAEQAFITLSNIYSAAGIVLPNGTPGASFVNVMANITAQQKATSKNP